MHSRIKERCARLAVMGALLGALSWSAAADSPAAPLFNLGGNGGVRLLLHCEGAVSFPSGKPTEDPCASVRAVSNTSDFVTEYDGTADTVMVWAYLYHPCRFAVHGVGFGIQYEGVKVVTAGTCAQLIYQDGETMGKWAQSGSEIAFAWTPESSGFKGILAPFAWFLLARTQPDAHFEVTAGKSDMAGAVADTSSVPLTNPIFAYGRIGFGETEGALPIEEPEKIAGAWGAVTISAR